MRFQEISESEAAATGAASSAAAGAAAADGAAAVGSAAAEPAVAGAAAVGAGAASAGVSTASGSNVTSMPAAPGRLCVHFSCLKTKVGTLKDCGVPMLRRAEAATETRKELLLS